MSEYLHGAYGGVQAAGTKVSQKSKSAIVYVGTAPVHLTTNGEGNVNKPVVVNNMAEAQKLFGYNNDWAKYTLCEAMHVHFDRYGVGPLILINVLDPKKHKADEATTVSLSPIGGKITLVNADTIILSSIVVPQKTAGTDYSVTYNQAKNIIEIHELTSGALGNQAISITYDEIDASKVTDADVIGSTDGEGLNIGLYAIKNIYQATGYIPGYLVVPGFSENISVHSVMFDICKKVNGHWDVYHMTDMPIVDGNNALTLSGAAAWKTANGYNRENETVSFPPVKGTDGNIYHLSVLRAAALQKLLLANDGIPYNTASNTECALIENLFLGADAEGRMFDDELINEKLNKNGIASAAYIGGRWALWGAHSADYTDTDGDEINVSETNRMMMYYLSNDFQHRRMGYVDKSLTVNDIKSIVAEEQSRLDALVKIGALTFGEAVLDAGMDARSDIMTGDFLFSFRVSTTPLAKSLSVNVYWTNEGLVAYYDNFYA